MTIEEIWQESILDLILSSRSNAGVSIKEVDIAIQHMCDVRDKYKGRESLPMFIVNILIDMQASLMTNGDRHRDSLNNREMANRIYEASLKLSSIARDMAT